MARRRCLVEILETRRLLAAELAGRWSLDEGSGTVAADSSGNGRNAVLSTGASWVSGNVGSKAMRVAGTSSGRATVTGPVVNTAGDFTVSAWVKLSSLGGFQTFVCTAGTNVAGFYLQLRGDTGAFAFARLASDANTSGIFAGASTAPTANTWYHLVGVNNASAATLTLYVNGQAVNTVAYTSGWTATGNTLIGQGFYGGQRTDYVNGSIDEVAIYSGALSSAEVTALDHSAAYPLEEGTGAVSADVSGNGNTLTLGSNAHWGEGHLDSSGLTLNGSASANASTSSPVLDTRMPYSVSAWVRLNSVSGTQTIASIDGNSTSGFYLQLRANGKFAFTRLATDSTSAAIYVAESTITPSTGSWYHLLGVNDVAGGQIRLYVNGSLQATTSAPAGWRATGATVIGAGKYGGNRVDYLDAQIDDVHFFNAALSSEAAAWLPHVGGDIDSVINVATQSNGITLSRDLFGLFMEDINYGGEGGVYSDLVRNGGFNDSSNPLNAWRAVTGTGVSASLSSDAGTGPTAALTKSAKLAIGSGVSASSRAGIANTGFFGVAVKPSTSYDLEFYAKATPGFAGPLTVALESNGGTVYAAATVPSITSSWAKYTAKLTTAANAPTTSANRLVISTTSASANGASIWFGSAHLFPPSYQGTNAHLRIDLMEKLAAMKPAFFRVPGGNYLEGNTYADRFAWSKTIGRLEDRPGHFNSAWGYWSSDGMGLDEYLQMAELIGARPILGLFAGYTLDGTSSTGAQLAADVQDALDELHYVLDPVTTSWGAMRAANGHPAPYNVREVEIGNEDWFSSTYSVRYPLFYDAIRAEFPSLKIIASHTDTGGRPYDMIDEHFYNSAAWFQGQQNRYDSYPRNGAKVIVGEYAAREGAPTNNLGAALGDATFLLGLMENSDVVTMSCYAPLWANVNGVQWNTNLIGFNNTHSYGSPSYHAQVMLSNLHGEMVVSSNLAGAGGGLRTLVTRTQDTYYLAVINVSGSDNTTVINLGGVGSVWPTATVTSLSGASSLSTNTITDPDRIVPTSFTLEGVSSSFAYSFPAYSLTIIELNANNQPIGAVPTVAVPASVATAPTQTTTRSISVLGADEGGEASLTYTWRVLGTPAAPVHFDSNGTNASKNTIATFGAAGTYQFQVTITNAGGRSVVSSVTTTIDPVAASFAIEPAASSLHVGMVVPFAVSMVDQFGDPINQAIPGLTWTATAGSISSAGVFTAPGTPGVVTINASAPGLGAGSVTFSVVNELYAWYEANASSGTSLADSSGRGNAALLSGSFAFGSGFTGNALRLTGGHATLPEGIMSGVGDFTIATWIRADSLETWARIFDFGNGPDVYMFLTSRSSAGSLRFAITTNGGSGEQILNGPALELNTWTHIAVTLLDNTATLYVNGAAVAINTGMTLRPADLGVTSQNYLGKSQYGVDPMFRGSIDDFRIYAAGLAGSEVASIYADWSRPTIATAAAASPQSFTGTSTDLSVLGSSPLGEAGLSYTWSVIGDPPAGVSFDHNGTNAAKNTVVRFTASGTYVLLVTVTDPSGAAVTSSVTVSVTMPVTTVTGTLHDYLTVQNGLSFTFSRDVGEQPWMNLITVDPIAGGTSLVPIDASYDAPTRTVRYTLPTALPDGRYRASLSAGGFLASAATLDFFVLAGDVNHDATVNFDDLLIVAQNYGQGGRTFSQGNLNYDAAGRVDFDDLLLLAQHYNQSLAVMSIASGNPRGGFAIHRRRDRQGPATVIV